MLALPEIFPVTISSAIIIRKMPNPYVAEYKIGICFMLEVLKSLISAWKQALTCLYAQITGKDSLCEIESGLLEILAFKRKAIEKPPDWNLPEQPELFNEFSW